MLLKDSASVSLGYIMRDIRFNVIMARSKRFRDSPILVVGCLGDREAILMAIQNSIQRIIIQSNSQLVVNSINVKKECQRIL